MTKKSRVPAGKNAHRQSRQNSAWLLIGGIALIAVAVLALVWFALSPNRGSGGTPQLQVSADRLDFGKQIFNTPVHASFEIKNAGTGTLTLSVPRSVTLLEGC
jgi:hypothetical protein